MTVTPSALVSGPPPAEPFIVAPISGDVFASGTQLPPSLSVAVSPSPFAGRTALRLTHAESSPVRLSVHDVLGREVAVLLDGEAGAGMHTAGFAAEGLASGVYVWRLVRGDAVENGRLPLLQ